jgi:glucose dehydrogenase/mono/diheme cytochrome c family protein
MRVLAALAVASILLLVVVSGCGGGTKKTASGVAAFPSGTPPEVSKAAAEWPAPNVDIANTRDVSGSKIDSGNVSKLGVAWTAPITATGVFGGYATTPVIANGVVYTQDLDSNVFAYDLKTGRQLWTHAYNSTSEGPNGVAIGYGRVYGTTTTFAFALDMKSGAEVWRSKQLTRNAHEGIDVQPAVFDHTVYVSTVPGNAKAFYKGNGVGILYALDASSGKEKWHFDTVPPTLWDPAHVDINSGGGLWYTPAFDDKGNMYADVANPAPWPGTNKYPWGESRPGPNLYTNSLLKFNQSSGKLEWFNQVLPHDLYDWDLHLPPMLAKVNGKQVVVVGGKMGYVYEIDSSSGKLLWKRAVGVHNGHDHDNELALQAESSAGRPGPIPGLHTPETVEPGALGGVETQMAVDGNTVYAAVVDLPVTYLTQEKLKLEFTQGKGELIALDLAIGAVKWDTKLPQPPYGAATLSNDLVFTTTFDGRVLALDSRTGKIVWTYRFPTSTNATVAIAGDTLVSAASIPSKGGPAEIVALRLGAHGALTPPAATTTAATTTGPATAAATGKQVFLQNCASCHTLAAAGASGTIGPSLDQTHPAAALVKRQVINGGKIMPSFKGRLTPRQIDAVAAYVARVANPNAKPPSGPGKGP